MKIFFLPFTLLCLIHVSFAATLEQCIEQTENNAAAQRCQELIDDGNHSEDIYVRLVEALNGIGKHVEATTMIDAGLSRHTASRDLKDLKVIVRSNLSEDEFLESQASNSPSSQAINKAQLKILKLQCLKKSGVEATDYCNQYIQQGGQDPDVVAKREALAETSSNIGTTASTSSIDESNEPPVQENQDALAGGSTLVTNTSGPNTENSNNTERPTRKDTGASDRRLVRSVQIALNELGLDAGTADGIAGEKTRTAIDSFYEKTGFSPKQKLGQALMDDLQQAGAMATAANSLYDQARRLLNSGNLEDAQRVLSEARRTASWIAEPEDLSQSVTSAIVDNREKIAEQKRSQAIELQAQERRIQGLISLAEQALISGDIPEAKTQINQAEAEGADVATISRLKAELASAEALEVKSREVESILADARIAIRNNHLNEAQVLLDKADNVDKQLANTSTLRSEIAIIKERQLAEQRNADKLHEDKKREDTIALLLNRGNILAQSGNTIQAIAVYNEVLELDQSNVQASEAIASLSMETRQQSQELNEILLRAKVMRTNRERKIAQFVEYMNTTIPDATKQLFE